MTVTPGRYNFNIYQGATFSLPLTISDVIGGSTVARDLTGYTARMKIKERITDSAAIIELTTANNRITIDPDQVTNKGVLSLLLAASTTTSLSFDRGVYDLELVSGNTVSRFLEGKVTLRKEVTN